MIGYIANGALSIDEGKGTITQKVPDRLFRTQPELDPTRLQPIGLHSTIYMKINFTEYIHKDYPINRLLLYQLILIDYLQTVCFYKVVCPFL